MMNKIAYKVISQYLIFAIALIVIDMALHYFNKGVFSGEELIRVLKPLALIAVTLLPIQIYRKSKKIKRD